MYRPDDSSSDDTGTRRFENPAADFVPQRPVEIHISLDYFQVGGADSGEVHFDQSFSLSRDGCGDIFRHRFPASSAHRKHRFTASRKRNGSIRRTLDSPWKDTFGLPSREEAFRIDREGDLSGELTPTSNGAIFEYCHFAEQTEQSDGG